MPSAVYSFKTASGGEWKVPFGDRFDEFSKAICIKVLRLLLMFCPLLAIGLVWRLIAIGQHQALLSYLALYGLCCTIRPEIEFPLPLDGLIPRVEFQAFREL